MPQDIDIFEDLRLRLVSGEFDYGTKLRAEVLRTRYGCAASTIREALLRLSAVGLVEFQEQRGFRMPDYSVERQHDITQTRILLETQGAVRSMARQSVDWEARLAAAHHKLSHIESRMQMMGMEGDLPALWMAAELEFHQTLISACGSDMLIALHLQVYHCYRQINVMADKALNDLAANIVEHKNIVDAAISGDPDLMQSRIHAHFQRHLLPQLRNDRVSLVG